MQTPCLQGPDDNMGIDLPASETLSEVRNCWSPKVVAQAQRDDPDISMVLSHLLKEWKKPAVEELQSMSCAARAVWAQFELFCYNRGFSI